MPGADSGGAFGGVSQLKLILLVEQGGVCLFVPGKKNQRCFSISVYSLLSVAAAVLS